MPKDELYSGALALRVPLWLLAGTYQALLKHNLYMHEAKIEATSPELRYRLKIMTPTWAVSMCRAIAEDDGKPKPYMVHRLAARRTSTSLALAGDMYVGEKPIVNTVVQYEAASDTTTCRYTGRALEAKYQGLMGAAGSQMQKMVVSHQRELERRSVAVLGMVMLAIRLLVR